MTLSRSGALAGVTAALILALAVNVTASGVDIVTIGWILVIVGAVGLLLSLIFWSSVGTWGPWRRETYVRDDPYYDRRPLP